MTARECKTGCGRMLEWDPNQQSKRPGGGAFVEVANGQKHNCPNFTKTNFQGKPYSGPTQSNMNLQTLATVETDIAAMKQELFELQKVVAELGSAVGKMSFKPSTEV